MPVPFAYSNIPDYMFIDLNCDMGEGLSNDAELMPYISSANIACGYHAGDEDIMKHTVQLALQHNVSIGAHPGFADKENFGRKEMRLSAHQITDLVSEQVYALQKVAGALGARLHHVKPHGALYNMAAADASLAHTIAVAVQSIDPALRLFGLSGSHSISEAKKINLPTASEVFADRTYQNDGSLTPRSQPDAMIESEDESIQQVLKMIREKIVVSVNAVPVTISAETVCLHGDGAHAAAFAKKIYHTLQQNQIDIQSL